MKPGAILSAAGVLYQQRELSPHEKEADNSKGKKVETLEVNSEFIIMAKKKRVIIVLFKHVEIIS